MTKKIKNIELVTLALYEIGGATKSKETEDIAVKADEIDNERFKWKNKKYKILHYGQQYSCWSWKYLCF